MVFAQSKQTWAFLQDQIIQRNNLVRRRHSFDDKVGAMDEVEKYVLRLHHGLITERVSPVESEVMTHLLSSSTITDNEFDDIKGKSQTSKTLKLLPLCQKHTHPLHLFDTRQRAENINNYFPSGNIKKENHHVYLGRSNHLDPQSHNVLSEHSYAYAQR